jgi:hypothetical protein
MHSHEVIREVEENSAGQGPLDQLTSALSHGERLTAEADALIDHFVANARRAGHSWTEIGQRLGVSKQAARQRFSTQVEKVGRERFMPRLRRCLDVAADLARRDGCEVVSTPYLLWALATSEGVAANVLSRVGLDLGLLRAAVRASVSGSGTPSDVVPDEGPETTEALSAAASLAMQQGHDYVGTEHLLFVLAGDPGSITHRLLNQLGVDFADIKRELHACFSAKGTRPKPRRDRRRRQDPTCSFCGRSEVPNDRLVAGPGVFICSDCARLATEISGEHHRPSRRSR